MWSFSVYEIDFSITINRPFTSLTSEQQTLSEKIQTALANVEHHAVGNVQITFASHKNTITVRYDDLLASTANQTSLPISNSNILPHHHSSFSGSIQSLPYDIFLPIVTRSFAPAEIIVRKVYVIVYDPILSNGQHLSDYLNWYDHADLTQGTVEFFKRVTNGMLNYEIVDTTVVTDGWPRKIDGFRYSEAQYLAVVRGQSPPHSPDQVDYNAIVNSPAFDICGRANRGEIDEVWIYNGPWFGFYESTLVGPNAYFYNSMPVPGPHSCNRIIPIMGPSPERDLDSAIHNFGHRAEATMTRVYGSWQQNRTTHNWERFALVTALSPNYSYSGCGNIHYPPNGVRDYDYTNSATVLSNCTDFNNYPNLSNPLSIATPVSYSLWNCNHLGFLEFWFSHLPAKTGCGSDAIASNWWKYVSDPQLALNPASLCR